MKKALYISDTLSLALDFVTSTQAILARKRSGKSYTASVEAEEMLEHSQQIVVIDPTSAWFGLRSSADGEGAGYQVVVFGGDHADAPLDARSGKAMARAIVEHGFSAIFDIGNWITDEQIQFVYEFSSELLRINRSAVHLFLDEADTFAPQMLEGKEQKKCLGATSRLVKQGGIKGIGVTMITQRSADLNKKVLSQIDSLTVLSMRHPPDIKPVTDWISTNIGPKYADEVAAALPRLEVGEAFYCSGPQGKGYQVKIRARRTFNSGATPKPGERQIVPKVLAKIDIAKLGAEIQASVERAKADDPAVLRQQIARLETDLRAAKAATVSVPVEMVPDPAAVEALVRKEIEAMADQARSIIGKDIALICSRICDSLTLSHEKITALRAEVSDPARWAAMPMPGAKTLQALPLVPKPGNPAPIRQAPAPFKRPDPLPHAARAPKRSTGDSGGSSDLPKGERSVLQVLAQHGPSKRLQISVFCGFARSTRDAYIQRLQGKGFVETNGDYVSMTSEGAAALGSWEALPTGRDLQAWWLDRLPGGEARVLEILCAQGRQVAVDRERISQATGFARSTRDAYIQRLGQKLLVDTSGGSVMASESLF